ncbi:MAG: acetyl-CoA carboxylase biotin carboxyl carrier protein [Planctomycetota bacterium]|nr:acetyl-CoA carboxylase biotin carboxyl carrier protein [Planctomycetota bacterium]MDA1179431.1 acetyl-CoA carboxylase biotin carboxyl carrier protein [Planctomycetota bacterium]
MGAGETRKSEEVFDIERLRELVELMEEHDLGEIDLRQASQRIRLRRAVDAPIMAMPPAILPPEQSISAAPRGQQLASEQNTGPATKSDNLVVITSPMVGTFYLRPRPDTESFVKVGDPIGPDTVVCIIEAMKVFNDIKAEMSGKIVAILVDNEEAVDFGRPLFKVDPSL